MFSYTHFSSTNPALWSAWPNGAEGSLGLPRREHMAQQEADWTPNWNWFLHLLNVTSDNVVALFESHLWNKYRNIYPIHVTATMWRVLKWKTWTVLIEIYSIIICIRWYSDSPHLFITVTLWHFIIRSIFLIKQIKAEKPNNLDLKSTYLIPEFWPFPSLVVESEGSVISLFWVRNCLQWVKFTFCAGFVLSNLEIKCYWPGLLY